MTRFQVSKRFRDLVEGRWPAAKFLVELPVGWTWWELDGEAAVISTGGKPFLVSTDHGGLCRSDPSFLKEKLAEYERWAQATREAIQVMEL